MLLPYDTAVVTSSQTPPGKAARHPSALADAISAAWRPYRWRAYAVGLAAGFVAGGVVAPLVTTPAEIVLSLAGFSPSTTRWPEVVWLAVFVVTMAAATTVTFARWQPRQLRMAAEAYIWLATNGARRSTTTVGMDRFREASVEWFNQFTSGDTPSFDTLETLAGAIDNDEDRLQASVELATNRARAALAAGGDWQAPLADIRSVLGADAGAAHRQLMWRTIFRAVLAVATAAAIVFWLARTLWPAATR